MVKAFEAGPMTTFGEPCDGRLPRLKQLRRRPTEPSQTGTAQVMAVERCCRRYRHAAWAIRLLTTPYIDAVAAFPNSGHSIRGNEVFVPVFRLHAA